MAEWKGRGKVVYGVHDASHGCDQTHSQRAAVYITDSVWKQRRRHGGIASLENNRNANKFGPIPPRCWRGNFPCCPRDGGMDSSSIDLYSLLNSSLRPSVAGPRPALPVLQPLYDYRVLYPCHSVIQWLHTCLEIGGTKIYRSGSPATTRCLDTQRVSPMEDCYCFVLDLAGGHTSSQFCSFSSYLARNPSSPADIVMSKPQYLTGDKPAIQDFLKRFDVRAFRSASSFLTMVGSELTYPSPGLPLRL